ncbi:hypothetical protein F5146DRAFT_1142300 [Armillaria mellea]|nr:hypothetical protein F5146DRAFT_1142300 [Armillaria mellea]
MAIQFRKPLSMKEDTTTHHSGEWYRQSLYNLDYDVFICGYNVLLHIIARFHEEATLGQSGLIDLERGNLQEATMRYDAEIELFKDEWKKKFKLGRTHHEAMVRCSELHFYIAYFRLVMFSSGFHQVFHAGKEAWYEYFFSKCLKHAKSVIRCMNKDLAPSGLMQYAPNHHFMCAAFAGAFIFKLLQREFPFHLDKAEENESVKLIEILINKFSSSEIAVDDRHTPKLYARFLATALAEYQQSIGTASRSSSMDSPVNTGTYRGMTGDPSNEGSDNFWQRVSQGYTSSSFDYWPEVTDPMNINVNIQVGVWWGITETAMITSIKNLNNTTE